MKRLVKTVSVIALIAISSTPALALEIGQCLPMANMNQAMKSEGQASLFVGDWVDYDGQVISVAGTDMTRGEWMRVDRDIRYDSPYRRDLIVKLKAKGRTSAQIEDFITKLRYVSEIAAKGDTNAPVPRRMMIFASNADGSFGYVIMGDHPQTEASSQACVRGKLTNLRIGTSDALVNSAGNRDLLTARGSITQVGGKNVSDVAVAVHGQVDGDAQLIVLQPGNPPLYMLRDLKARPAAMAFAKR